MLLIITGCNKHDIMITVELLDQPEVNSLVYSVPILGTNFLGFVDTLKQNETGKFELNLKITQPSFITIWDEDYTNRVKILVEPGNSYHVVMDTLENVQITGANAKGQMLYATFPDPNYIEVELRKIGINHLNPNDTVSLMYVHDKISELKHSEISKFKELLDNREISKSYFDLILKDRDCYYASFETRFSIIKANQKIEDNLLEKLKQIYDQYPPHDESLLFSSFWREYVEQFIIGYKQYFQKDFSYQKIQNLRKDGTYYTYIIEESKKILNGKALEFFQAIHINKGCGSFEKGLISLFEQFEKDYPKSEYSKYLKPGIDNLIYYYQVIVKPFDPAIRLMDNYETINTLEEAIQPLQGKKIYVDVWGTWCGPCRAEFIHSKALKKILEEHDIQQLYISIGDNDDQKWRNYIKYYHLTGTHIRGNQELFIDLEKKYSKNLSHSYIAIPWYILIDEKGNILEEYAKSPSELVSGEKLFAND